MAGKEKSSRNNAPLTNSEKPRRQRRKGTNAPTDLAAEANSTPTPESARQVWHCLQIQRREPRVQGEPLRPSQLEQDRAQATYLDLYDFAPVGYCTISDDGAILQANITAANLLGVTRDNLLKQYLSEFVTEEDLSRHCILCKQILLTGEPYSYQLWMEKSNGSKVLVHLAASATQEADGTRMLRVALSSISESKIPALALDESKQFAQSILDSIPFQIAVINNDGTIIKVNRAWRQTTQGNGQGPGEGTTHSHVGRNYLDICRTSHGNYSESAAEAHDGILAVLNGQTPRFKLDYPCPSLNQQRWFTLYVTPIINHGAVIAHVDITERKIAEAHLAQHRDTLVREVHHRIKNNLQGVAGLLQRELGKHQELSTRLATAIGQVNTIAIVHGLQAAYSDETISLSENISHICTMVSGLSKHPVLFEIEQQPSFMPIHINHNETVSVALVVNELILNAAKHTPDESCPPSVSLRADGISARVSIRNAIAGSPDFNINTGKGLGTGLSLVRSLLPKQGAHLTYKLDQQGFILATLCLTAPVVLAAIQKDSD